MDLYKVIEDLTDLCERQAEIIKRLSAALAQVDAEIDEDDRVGSGLMEEE